MKSGPPIKPPDEESDWDLVERFQGGDMAAFEVLYYRHFDYIRRLVWKWLWDKRPENVEDAVQRVFVIVCKRLPSFKFEAKLTTWLCSITLNEMRNINRKCAKERGIFCPLPGTVEELQKLLVELGVSQPAEDAIWKAIDSLSEKQKEVTYLQIGRHSHEEMAKILVVGKRVIKSRLHEARQSLKNRLGLNRRHFHMNGGDK